MPGTSLHSNGPTTQPPRQAPPPKTSEVPNDKGRFGAYGGQYVPETLMPALQELEQAYTRARHDPKFWEDLHALLKSFVGRPTPLYFAEGLTQYVRARLGRGATGGSSASGGGGGGGSGGSGGGGAKIWLKREDLCHTGAHKVNNTMGQAMLAVRMGKKRLIAETGAGQHGVATATAAAHFGLSCEVYMGAEDARRQKLNVTRMKLLGAKVVEVTTGSQTLKDATNEAMRDWMASSDSTHYILGSVVGPHPFPMIVRDFQSIIGRESKAQCLRMFGKMPDMVIACVGGGSNAAGIFYPFIDDTPVKLVGVEAGGRSSSAGDHAATLAAGKPGVLHGCMSYVLQDDFGQTASVHSCSAGLDYPGVGPEHAYWKDLARVSYAVATDDEALDAFQLLASTEGIIPALESAHAIAESVKRAMELKPDHNIVVNLSGRGDKDVDEASRLLSIRVQGTPLAR